MITETAQAVSSKTLIRNVEPKIVGGVGKMIRFAFLAPTVLERVLGLSNSLSRKHF
jgi:hypothetical protein